MTKERKGGELTIALMSTGRGRGWSVFLVAIRKDRCGIDLCKRTCNTPVNAEVNQSSDESEDSLDPQDLQHLSELARFMKRQETRQSIFHIELVDPESPHQPFQDLCGRFDQDMPAQSPQKLPDRRIQNVILIFSELGPVRVLGPLAEKIVLELLESRVDREELFEAALSQSMDRLEGMGGCLAWSEKVGVPLLESPGT